MQKKRINKFVYCAGLILLAAFVLWFAFGAAAYFRRITDERETIRQSEALRGQSDKSVVLAARDIMNNDEIIAHIAVSGTAIDYAVAHGQDNEFYLSHDLMRRPNENGAIFLDYANSPDFTDRNTIIYGHNRRSGIKFHDLQLFQDREFFEENGHIVITTLDGVFIYEIFAVFLAHISFQYIQVDFADDYDFLFLVAEIKDRAMHTRNVSISACDRMLILSTCTNVGPTGRLAVAGRLIT